MAVKPIILTPEGYKKLEEELRTLKVEGRKEIAEKIKEARSYGDLSENAEYDAAKDAQASMEQRITTIENMLKNAQIVSESDVTTDAISIGSRVKLYDIEFEEEMEYTIVGSTEANPDEGRISDESPIGSAILGHKVDEVVDVELPNGEVIQFKVLEINK
ncbi:MAG: transcription elongation factor GreA [Clostridia bacterium]|nr:transcription elongation factor GreA [Clostridia bacterium]